MAEDNNKGNFLMNLFKRIYTTSNEFITTHLGAFVIIVKLILVFGGEELLQTVLNWKCPASPEYAQQSGILFIFAPAIVALLLSFPLDWTNYRLCHGCCPKGGKINGTPVTAMERLTIFYKICIGPVFWIAACFFDGRYYACIVSCEEKEADCQEKLVADSRLIAWILVIIFIFLGFICKAMIHCCSNTSFDCWQYHGLHQNAVKDILFEEMRAHAKTSGKAEVDEMIQIVTTTYDEERSEKKSVKKDEKREKKDAKSEEISSEEIVKKS